MPVDTSQNATLALLSSIDIFSGLTQEDLLVLSGKANRRSFRKRTPVFRENEEGKELYIIDHGLVSITIQSPDGEDIELSRVGPGGFFGEMSLLERAPRSATCTALEATRCLVLETEDFDALMKEYPKAAMAVLKRMLEISAGRLLKTGAFLSQMVQWGDSARKRAVTDGPTGLFNRRYMEDSFESIVARAKREGTELSFAMFDLDRFGKLNTQYGAVFCDNIILQVASTFKTVFNDEDILIRYGGDEFCFILPRPAALASKKCEEVCAAVRAIKFPEHPELAISCSIGVAAFPITASGTEELKDYADKALYQAKEAGRDRTVVWTGTDEEPKHNITSIGVKNHIIKAIITALDERDSFLIIGHKDPDEDCISSMVAFALIATKLNKKASIALGDMTQNNFDYLLNICRYNSIDIIHEEPLPPCSTLVLVDTPKPAMIDHKERYEKLRKDPAVLKIELDHHLDADSRYFGDPGYRLVYEASSTCEIIAVLAMKMGNMDSLTTKYQITELLSRNLVLAILSGMIGDSRMGRYLKSRRERWFYARFSALFERILESKTLSNSGNFSSKEQVFEALDALTQDEESCFQFIIGHMKEAGGVRYAVLNDQDSQELFNRFGHDTTVTVSRAVVDRLAEESGHLGFVGYFDDAAVSSFVQFRLRRSQGFMTLDLREALPLMGITNGGGHPGAVGFRIDKKDMENIHDSAQEFARILNTLIDIQLNSGK